MQIQHEAVEEEGERERVSERVRERVIPSAAKLANWRPAEGQQHVYLPVRINESINHKSILLSKSVCVPLEWQ